MSQNTVRRKITREEITARNKERDRNRAQTKAEKEQAKKFFWEEFEQHYIDCLSLFNDVRDLGGIISSPVVDKNIGEQRQNLLRMANELVRDVKTYRANLDAIYSKHAGRKGEIKDEFEILGTYNLVMEYHQWRDSFNTVILPKMGDISDLILSLKETESQVAEVSDTK